MERPCISSPVLNHGCAPGFMLRLVGNTDGLSLPLLWLDSVQLLSKQSAFEDLAAQQPNPSEGVERPNPKKLKYHRILLYLMEVKTKARKWGSSLAVILPKKVVEETRIHEDDKVVIEVKKRSLASEFFGKFPRTSRRTAQQRKDEAREGWE